MIELLVAMAIVAGALIPIGYSVVSEGRLIRALYQRAVAVEIVDGEMEALAAGGWQAFHAGVTEYPIRAMAATNLPPGRFLLTITPDKLRLEWRPSVKHHGGAVVREVKRK